MTLADAQVVATAVAAGVKGSDGQPIEIPVLGEELAKFDAALARPLNYERIRQAILREVTA